MMAEAKKRKIRGGHGGGLFDEDVATARFAGKIGLDLPAEK
jgi:hypothetical protein